jgi:Protein of unknown function (DUF1571)
MQRLVKVWRLRSKCRFPSGATRLNCLAALIGLITLAVLMLSFQAAPAGAGLDAHRRMGRSLGVAAVAPAAQVIGDQNAMAGLNLEEVNRQIQSSISTSPIALQLHVTLLELGVQRMEHIASYKATFFKQERLDEQELQELQTCQIKVRHAPFSVYMKWIEGGDVGRNLLFVDGKYDNELQVRLGGMKVRLPVLKLNPTGSVAMAESRHPVTEMGLQNLAKLILQYRKRDLTLKTGVRWQMLADERLFDRDCYGFVTEYESREVEPTYRKSITYIDKEHSLPICVRNFGWPAAEKVEKADAESTDEETGTALTLDEATLVEYYGYKDLEFATVMTDDDFSKANPDYTFKR